MFKLDGVRYVRISPNDSELAKHDMTWFSGKFTFLTTFAPQTFKITWWSKLAMVTRALMYSSVVDQSKDKKRA